MKTSSFHNLNVTLACVYLRARTTRCTGGTTRARSPSCNGRTTRASRHLFPRLPSRNAASVTTGRSVISNVRGDVPRYDLTLAGTDSAQGAAVRAVWVEFAATRRVEGWTPVDGTAAAAAAASYYVAMHLTNNVTKARENWKADECALWSAFGVGGPEFWWAN